MPRLTHKICYFWTLITGRYRLSEGHAKA